MSNFRIVFWAATFAILGATFGVDAQDRVCRENHYILDYAGKAWLPTGDLNVPRSFHTATLLPDGRVLVAGGRGADSGALPSAELYDPATGGWTLTGSLSRPRVAHTATLLPNGKVLIIGGGTLTPGSLGLDGTAELYDPNTGNWSPTGNLNTARTGFTATLLATGKVLVAGGVDDSDDSLNSAELYDPATGTWSFTGDLNSARLLHTATPLQDGRILVAGGWTDDFFQWTTSAVELYDPVTGTWSSAAPLNQRRVFHTATTLQDGRVLVAAGYRSDPPGGYGTYVPTSFNEAELFDPTTGTWEIVGNLNGAREGHTATLLPDGEVLVAGGFDWNSRLNVNGAELYEPASATWTVTGSLGAARIGHTATLLPNGTVLVVGGYFVPLSYEDITLGSAELYGAGISSCP